MTKKNSGVSRRTGALPPLQFRFGTTASVCHPHFISATWLVQTTSIHLMRPDSYHKLALCISFSYLLTY